MSGKRFKPAIVTDMSVADHQASTKEGTLVRPSYGQRANRRFPFVLALCVAIHLGWSLFSGLSVWAALSTLLPSAYGLVITAALLTLLVAAVPGNPQLVEANRPEPLPRPRSR